MLHASNSLVSNFHNPSSSVQSAVAWWFPIAPVLRAMLSGTHPQSSAHLLRAKQCDPMENATRNTLQTAAAKENAAGVHLSSSASNFDPDSEYIQHTRRDSNGFSVTKRYLKGNLLGTLSARCPT